MAQWKNDVDKHTPEEDGEKADGTVIDAQPVVEDEILRKRQWFVKRRYITLKSIGENGKFGIICQIIFLTYFIHDISIPKLHSME